MGKSNSSVIVPDGLKKEHVADMLEFQKNMIEAYTAFLAERKAGKLQDIDTYGKMHDWVVKFKEKEGYKLKNGGSTDDFGNIIVDGEDDEDRTPEQEFEGELTRKVHEPSHVAGNKKRAEAAGLDWDKWQRYGELQRKREAGTLTGEEMAELLELLKYILAHKKNVDEYRESFKNLEEAAREEIGEYSAENAVKEGVIEKLDGKIGIMNEEQAYKDHEIKLFLVNIEMGIHDGWTRSDQFEFVFDTDKTSTRHEENGTFDDLGNFSARLPVDAIDSFEDTGNDHPFTISIKGTSTGVNGMKAFRDYPVTIGCNDKETITVTLRMVLKSPPCFAESAFTFRIQAACK